eukprot:TRINITY_DN227_c0_g1_i3.p1 TRINITY_DN227_c0_g1~~TRINITY_DN227_c0_g1_i3.p1  ORF type:complete len:203 (+),score=105.32 TRINITY_DN227_c0_g1_i3:69-611(+)
MNKFILVLVLLLLGLFQVLASEVEADSELEAADGVSADADYAYYKLLKYKPVRQAAWWAVKKGAQNKYVRGYVMRKAREAAVNAITSPFRNAYNRIRGRSATQAPRRGWFSRFGRGQQQQQQQQQSRRGWFSRFGRQQPATQAPRRNWFGNWGRRQPATQAPARRNWFGNWGRRNAEPEY